MESIVFAYRPSDPKLLVSTEFATGTSVIRRYLTCCSTLETCSSKVYARGIKWNGEHRTSVLSSCIVSKCGIPADEARNIELKVQCSCGQRRGLHGVVDDEWGHRLPNLWWIHFCRQIGDRLCGGFIHIIYVIVYIPKRAYFRNTNSAKPAYHCKCLVLVDRALQTASTNRRRNPFGPRTR